MRVLFLTHRLPYAPNRGDRIRAYHLLRFLSSQAAIDLVSLVHDKQEARHVGELRSMVASATVVRVPRIKNLFRCVPALFTRKPLTHVLLHAPGFARALRAVTQAHPPDVVLAYCSGTAQYLFGPELRDVPAVLDMVDVDSGKWADLACVNAWPKQWLFRREAAVLGAFEARAAVRAAVVLTVNDRERAALTALAPTARIVTLPIGVDSAAYRPTTSPVNQPVVVFSGVMNYEPNVRGATWLIHDVWPLVRAVRPDARLFLVGATPAAAVRSLQSAAKGITVTGSVPDVRPFLWSAALAVAPLRVARGVQTKVLEALAAGLPCVVTAAVAQGLPAEAAPGCRVADTPRQFADEILELLRWEPADRRALATEAAIEQLDWTRQLGLLPDLLRAASGDGAAMDLRSHRH